MELVLDHRRRWAASAQACVVCPCPRRRAGVQEGRLPRVLEVTILSSVTHHPWHTRHMCPGWQKGGTAAHPPACKFRAFIRLPAVVASWGPISRRGLSWTPLGEAGFDSWLACFLFLAFVGLCSRLPPSLAFRVALSCPSGSVMKGSFPTVLAGLASWGLIHSGGCKE